MTKRPSKVINGKQKAISRVIYEIYLGRELNSDELIHHINRNPKDNRLENLQLVTRAEHKKLHDDIGKKTRFKRKYFLDEKEILKLYLKLNSAIKVAELKGCSEITIRRLIKKLTNKSLNEIKNNK